MELPPELARILHRAQEIVGPAVRPVFDDFAEGLQYRTTARFKADQMLDFAMWFEQAVESRGMDKAALSPKFREAFPILGAVSTETDPTMKELWAGLLASSSDPVSEPFSVNFTAILLQLAPNEARVLKAIRELERPARGERSDSNDREVVGPDAEQLASYCDMQVKSVLGHLTALGLVGGDLRVVDGGHAGTATYVSASEEGIVLSSLGLDLLTACTGE